MVKEYELLEKFRDLHLNTEIRINSLMMSETRISRNLEDKIKIALESDEFYRKIKKQIEQGKAKEFEIGQDGLLRFKNRLYLPLGQDIRETILEEAHKSKYTIHPGISKMYHDLKGDF